MFSRQWFAPGSQIGISQSGIDLEDTLQNQDFGSALRIIAEEACKDHSSYWRRQFLRVSNIIGHHLCEPEQRKPIHICFSDFWPNFSPYNNQLLDFFETALHLLSPDCKLGVTLDPSIADIAVFSCYGDLSNIAHCGTATRVLFLGENIRPRYDIFDYSLSFDLSSYGGRNIHCPLWMLELDWFSKSTYPDRITYPLSRFIETKTCDYSTRKNAVVFIGNNAEPFRRYMIETLRSNGIHVDEFGSHSKPVDDKIELLDRYKITLCPENSYFPGYVTEKPVHPFLAGTQMLYWGGSDHLMLRNLDYIRFLSHSDTRSGVLSDVKELLSSSGMITFRPLFSEQILREHFGAALKGYKAILAPYIAGTK